MKNIAAYLILILKLKEMILACSSDARSVVSAEVRKLVPVTENTALFQ